MPPAGTAKIYCRRALARAQAVRYFHWREAVAARYLQCSRAYRFPFSSVRSAPAALRARGSRQAGSGGGEMVACLQRRASQVKWRSASS